ncbi:MAG: glycerophosphodiester phosphodiesterase [Anaerolineae bacterium]
MVKVFKWIAGIIGVLLVVAVIGIAVMIVIAQPRPDHPFFANLPDHDVLILAHQGGDGEFPGNTLYAFEQATALGVDVLEMDVHSSADGTIMVIHDDTVDRTTDASGRVNELTVTELQALDAGYHWPTLGGHPLSDSGEYPYRGQGITIPTLEEIFQAFPDMPMSVEIKQETPSIAQTLCGLIRQYEREDLTIVPSFRTGAMQEFRDVCPEVATAGVEPEVIAFFAWSYVGLGSAWQPTTESFMVPEYQGDLQVISARFVNQLQAQNVAIYPWTINDSQQMQRMIDLGVDGLITDYPTQALALLGR